MENIYIKLKAPSDGVIEIEPGTDVEPQQRGASGGNYAVEQQMQSSER